MPVERVYSHPSLRQNINQAAIQRGPVVYCLQQVDNPAELPRVFFPKEEELVIDCDEQLLGGIIKISRNAKQLDNRYWKGQLNKFVTLPLVAVPYYAWDNGEYGSVRVWIQEDWF